MLDDNDDTYYCVDCMFCKVSIFTYINHLGNVPPSKYKCKKRTNQHYVKNLVKGPIIGFFYKNINCEEARRDFCGATAKFWKPKKKKDLFKYLRKQHIHQ